MERYPREQRTRINSWYYENRKCIIKTQRAYKRNYGSKSAPVARTIKKMVQNFDEYGTVTDNPRIRVTDYQNPRKYQKNSIWSIRQNDHSDDCQKRQKYPGHRSAGSCLMISRCSHKIQQINCRFSF